jgi:hypothetical protein
MIPVNLDNYAEFFMTRSRGEEVFTKMTEFLKHQQEQNISANNMIVIKMDENKLISYSFLDEMVKQLNIYYKGAYSFEFKSGEKSSIYNKLARISGFRNINIHYQTPASDQILDIIPTVPKPLPIFEPEEKNPPISIAVARVLWIEAGFLSGGSRSQIEFPENLGPYFGLSKTQTDAHIRLIYAGTVFPSKRIEFHNRTVWRLNLPTASQGLGGYEGKFLVFEKTGEIDVFRLWIINTDSPILNELKNMTHQNNRGSKTREYGYF